MRHKINRGELQRSAELLCFFHKIPDNGIGILPSSLPHIFERMYQCDDSRLADGNGLGLAIVKELVSAHKGKIKAESTPSAGITFTITFRKAL